jgi:HEPN domain-containing protein
MVRFAEMDLSSAKHLLTHYPLPIEIICYHCQQAAEKILKGVLVLRKIMPPKIHNLPDLCAILAANDEPVKTLLPQLERLNQYGTMPRYPREMAVIADDVPLAIAAAETGLNFLKPNFPAPPIVGAAPEK